MFCSVHSFLHIGMPTHAIGLIITSYKPWYLGLYRSMCMHIVFRQDVSLWQSVTEWTWGQVWARLRPSNHDMKQPHGAFLLLEQAITVVLMQMQAAVCSVALVTFSWIVVTIRPLLGVD